MIRKLLVGILAASAAISVITAGPAHASPVPSAEPAERQIRGTMILDCNNMTKTVHDYAVSHGYCAGVSARSVSGAKTGSIRPNNTVTGTCGASWIYATDSGYRQATFSYGFASILGAVVYRQLNGIWDSSSGLDGAWGDSGYMLSPGYTATRTRTTGRGAVYVSLSGVVTLAWGGKCYLKVPFDVESID